MSYILIDTANMFFRARHVARGSVDMKIGLCYHIMFNSIKKAFNDFGNGHVVFCLEGRSWRRSIYEPYKKNRDASRDALENVTNEAAAVARDSQRTAAARDGGPSGGGGAPGEGHEPGPRLPGGEVRAPPGAWREQGESREQGETREQG